MSPTKVYLNEVGYHECRFVFRVRVNDSGELIAEGHVELEIRAFLFVKRESQHHLPESDRPQTVIHTARHKRVCISWQNYRIRQKHTSQARYFVLHSGADLLKKKFNKQFMIKKTHFAKRQTPDRCALMGMGKYFF